MRISLDDANSRPHFKQWEQRFGQHPNVLRALAISYQQANQPEDSTRCLNRYLAISPDQRAYFDMADVLWKQENYDEWKRVLLLSLDQENFALAHTRTRVKIARFHMNRREWEQALPYADQAASSGAAWALLCAAECHEALEHWRESEDLTKSAAMSYADREMEWYLWCRRTGRGDLQPARQLARKRVLALSGRSTAYDTAAVGTYFVLTGEKKQARNAFKAGFDKTTSFNGGLHVALLDDELGLTEERDAVLAEILSEKGQKANAKTPAYKELMAFTEWLAATYRQPADAQIDLATIQEIADVPAGLGTANVLYFIGAYFYDHKDWARARKYLRAAAAADTQQLWNTTLAMAKLQEIPDETEKAADAPAQGK